jgi:hypothetical protein
VKRYNKKELIFMSLNLSADHSLSGPIEELESNSGKINLHSHKKQELFALMIICTMMLMYILMGSFCEQRKCPFGHATGFIIVVGMLVSYLVWLSNGEISS